MSLQVCPTCKVQYSIFLPLPPAIGLDGKLSGGRVEAFCNNVRCDQRYWYFPSSGVVTRRNTGGTYQDWRLRRVDLAVVNAMRKNEGLSQLVEEPIPVGSYQGIVIEGDTGKLHFPARVPVTSQSGWRQTATGRVYWLRSTFRLMLPGGGKE